MTGSKLHCMKRLEKQLWGSCYSALCVSATGYKFPSCRLSLPKDPASQMLFCLH